MRYLSDGAMIIFTGSDARFQVTSHIPDQRTQLVHYYGTYSNAHAGKVDPAPETRRPDRFPGPPPVSRPSQGKRKCLSHYRPSGAADGSAFAVTGQRLLTKDSLSPAILCSSRNRSSAILPWFPVQPRASSRRCFMPIPAAVALIPTTADLKEIAQAGPITDARFPPRDSQPSPSYMNFSLKSLSAISSFSRYGEAARASLPRREVVL